jgi:abortive infection bacteriophage resistance protein
MPSIPFTKQPLTLSEQIALLRPELFVDHSTRWSYGGSHRQLEQEFAESREPFMVHLREKYAEPLPPVWAAVEIMTLGQLSKWYANLSHRYDRNGIARALDFDDSHLVSFLHHLAFIRNLCAHHNRVWNRYFAFSLKLPTHRPVALRGSLNPDAPKKLYNTLAILAYFLDTISPGHHWKSRLEALLQDHAISTADMGFPPDWHDRAIWR